MEAGRLLGTLISEVRRGHNLVQGVFSTLRKFLKFFQFAFSVTSRRWTSTSRRWLNHEKSSLGQVATLDFNVATLATPVLYTSLSRRDIGLHVVTSVNTTLCHVATLANKPSGTSRR